MSVIRRGFSFSLIRNVRQLEAGRTVAEHQWPLDASDLAAMHGKLSVLAEVGGVQGLAGALRTSPKTGLLEDECGPGSAAAMELRSRMFGRNVFPRAPLKTFWEHCKDALEDTMLRVLMVAGLVSSVFGAIDDPSHGWTEGVAIYFAVFLVTTVGAFNNMQQERAFRDLESTQGEETYRVTRAGATVRVRQSEIVVGDVVALQAGDAVPADGVLVVGDDPATNESKMTGESDDIPKNAHSPFLLGGTEVRRGQLEMLVVGVGVNSAYGRIMSSLAVPPGDTPLQEKLEHVAALIGKVGGAVAVLLFLALTAQWAVELARDGGSFTGSVGEVLDFFIIAVVVVVVAVPEGLPLAVTVSLAYSMKKMVRDQNLVRVLSACETMGNCTTICSDKTGTLTQNVMTVMKGWVAGSFHERMDQAPPLDEATRRLLVEGVVVNSRAEREADPVTGREVWKGSQTEIALMQWMEKYGVNAAEARLHFVVRKNYPFDSVKKNSSIILRRHGHEGFRRYFKGAAELVLADCASAVDASGAVVPLEGALRERVSAAIGSMTRTGLRTIAFAYRDYDEIAADPSDPTQLQDPPQTSDLVFFGCVGIKDPLRPESRDSVLQCQRAGVIVRMVTGDHLETARFIAREAAILTSDDHVAMTGAEFRALLSVPDEAERVLPRLRVLARSSPDDKRALVEWMQDHGHVVAVTGDGTNDAPALKKADVGIAMNLVGTAVAKQAAKILILDDNFASIVRAIMWGRSVFDNIRKFVQFQLTVNVVAITLTLVGAFTGYENPLKPVQLLWVNLIMDTMAALALGTEEPTTALLERRPYRRDGPLISRLMWRNILGQSLMQLVVLMSVLYAGAGFLRVEDGSVEHYTVVFNAFVFMQIFNEVNSRKVNGEHNVFEDFFTNHIFLGIIFVTVVIQLVIVELPAVYPGFGDFTKTAPLSGRQWLICVLLGAISLPWGALVRLVRFDPSEGSVEVDPSAFRDGAAPPVQHAQPHARAPHPRVAFDAGSVEAH